MLSLPQVQCAGRVPTLKFFIFTGMVIQPFYICFSVTKKTSIYKHHGNVNLVSLVNYLNLIG